MAVDRESQLCNSSEADTVLMAVASRHHDVPTKSKAIEALATIDVEDRPPFKEDQSDGKVGWTIRKIFAAVALAMFYTSSAIPVYFTSATAASIARDLKASQPVLGWLLSINPLAVAVISPLVGHLEDAFGKRYIALFGATLICLGCILIGTAERLAQAMSGMVLAGIGAGVGEQTGIAGLAETVPVKSRGYSVAFLVAFSLPFTPYVMYSELLTSRGHDRSWRWGIWICFIWSAIALVGLTFCYFPRAYTPTEGKHWAAVFVRLDYVGCISSSAAIALILVALQVCGPTHSWTSAYTLCILLAGIALLGTWIIWEWRFAKYPMVPKTLFTGQRAVGLAFAVAFVAGMNFLALLGFWPLTISKVWDADPITNGWRALPIAISTALGGICCNVLLSVWPGGHRYILFMASLIMTVFGGSLASVTPNNVVQQVILATIAAFGVGSVIIPAAAVAVIVCPDALITTCAALSVSVRAVGAAVGFSIYYSIFNQRLSTLLPKLVEKYATQAGLPQTSVQSFVHTFVTTPEQAASIPGASFAVLAQAAEGAQWAYAGSLHSVWYASIGFGICAMICSLCIPDTKAYQTNRIAVAL